MKGGPWCFFVFHPFLTCSDRCNIEEEYASRLAKLAKAPIGGDEIGYLAFFFFFFHPDICSLFNLVNCAIL
jgi:hypothetical protein